MWIPRTESDIQQAIANGVLRETSSFDAKAALPRPGRNKDLAKDICAMTVDGGLLLYGVGGEDATRPDTCMPFELAGAAERIDQVAQTSIAEPPVVEIRDIPAADQPGHGYLAVVIPASPRAPHMLTIDQDNRFWGRGATGNRILTEGDVARLYARRERWEIDRGRLLDDAIAAMPFSFDDQRLSPMVVIARPAGASPDLLTRAVSDADPATFFRDVLLRVARENDPYPDQGSPGLGQALRIARQGADTWILASEGNPAFPYQARVEVARDATMTYWHSPTVHEHNGRRLLLERSVTRAAHQTVSTAGWLYERGGYFSSVDLAIAVLDIEDAVGSSAANAYAIQLAAYGASEYRRDERVTTVELTGQAQAVTRRLVEPLFDVISLRGYDAFGDR